MFDAKHADPYEKFNRWHSSRTFFNGKQNPCYQGIGKKKYIFHCLILDFDFIDNNRFLDSVEWQSAHNFDHNSQNIGRGYQFSYFFFFFLFYCLIKCHTCGVRLFFLLLFLIIFFIISHSKYHFCRLIIHHSSFYHNS